nr:hypothetical protein [Bacteroidota bacterium]
MARTEQEIYDAALTEKELKSELNVLTSESNASIWRLWLYIPAKIIQWLEELFDDHKSDTEVLISEKEFATIPWYIDQLKKFQYGDALTLIDLKYQYAVVDPTKNRVHRAAVVEDPDGELVVKVAKDTEGTLGPLIPDEQNSLTAYLNKIKAPGTIVTLLS